MGFEHANGAFSCIVAMNVGRDKLVEHLPNIFHNPFVILTGFIVQDLGIN